MGLLFGQRFWILPDRQCGNEEAFWQKLDRGDVKRLQFGDFLQRDQPMLVSRHIASRRVTSRCVTLPHVTLGVIPCLQLNIGAECVRLYLTTLTQQNVKLGYA